MSLVQKGKKEKTFESNITRRSKIKVSLLRLPPYSSNLHSIELARGKIKGDVAATVNTKREAKNTTFEPGGKEKNGKSYFKSL